MERCSFTKHANKWIARDRMLPSRCTDFGLMIGMVIVTVGYHCLLVGGWVEAPPPPRSHRFSWKHFPDRLALTNRGSQENLRRTRFWKQHIQLKINEEKKLFSACLEIFQTRKWQLYCNGVLASVILSENATRNSQGRSNFHILLRERGWKVKQW